MIIILKIINIIQNKKNLKRLKNKEKINNKKKKMSSKVS